MSDDVDKDLKYWVPTQGGKPLMHLKSDTEEAAWTRLRRIALTASKIQMREQGFDVAVYTESAVEQYHRDQEQS